MYYNIDYKISFSLYGLNGEFSGSKMISVENIDSIEVDKIAEQLFALVNLSCKSKAENPVLIEVHKIDENNTQIAEMSIDKHDKGYMLFVRTDSKEPLSKPCNTISVSEFAKILRLILES